MVAHIGDMVQQVLQRPVTFSVKIWTVATRRLARGTNVVLIPTVEVTFPEAPGTAMDFKKGAAIRAKNQEGIFEGVYFSLYLGLQTRVRIEVRFVPAFYV